jgi:hypothetical protein
MSQIFSKFKIPFSVSAINPCLARPAFAEVIELRLIHYGIDI